MPIPANMQNASRQAASVDLGGRIGAFGPATVRDSGIGVVPASRMAGMGETAPPKTAGQTAKDYAQTEKDKQLAKDKNLLDLKQKAQSGQVYVEGEPKDLTWAGPALTSLSAIAINIPPPWGIIVSIVLAKLAEGAEAIRGLFKVAATGAIKHLPVNVSAKVLAALEGASSEWKTAAAIDKYVQWNAEQIAPTRLTNKAMMTGLLDKFGGGIDDGVYWRFADQMYALCLSCGAQKWQAATVASGVTWACMPKSGSAAVRAHWEMYVKQVYDAAGMTFTPKLGVMPAWTACVKKSGGVVVDVATANALFSNSPSVSSSGGGGGLIAAAAAAVAAKLLFF